MQAIDEETLKRIASELDIGMRCIYSKITGEIESYPKESEYSDVQVVSETATGKIESDPGNYIEFEAMDSYETFKLASGFVETLVHVPTYKRFIEVLSRKRALRNFKNLLQENPGLREEWFAYKNERYIDFVKMQADEFLEYSTTIKQSFNPLFCGRLEYHLTRAFNHSPDLTISEIWCDGVDMPFNSRQLELAKVLRTKIVDTEAFIGATGQDRYRMIIHLGPLAIERCIRGLNLEPCLPDEETLTWVRIDFKNKSLEICLK